MDFGMILLKEVLSTKLKCILIKLVGMRFILSIVFITLYASVITAQDYLWEEKGKIVSELSNFVNPKFNLITDTSKISFINNGVDSLHAIYFLRPYSNGKIDDESICDSMLVNLKCTNCSEYHISTFVNDKKRKWYRLSDSTYISSKWVSKFSASGKKEVVFTWPVMKIRKQKLNSIIVLYTIEMTRKQYKESKRIVVEI